MPKLKTLAVGQRFRDEGDDEGRVLEQQRGGPGVPPRTVVEYDDPELGVCTEYGNDDVEVLA